MSNNKRRSSKRSWNAPAADNSRRAPQPQHPEEKTSEEDEDGFSVFNASLVLSEDFKSQTSPDEMVTQMVAKWPSLHMASKLRGHVILSFKDASDFDKAIDAGFVIDGNHHEIVPGTNPHGIKLFLRGLPGGCSEAALKKAILLKLGRPTKVQPLLYSNTQVWTGAAIAWVICDAAKLPEHIHVCGHPVRLSRDKHEHAATSLTPQPNASNDLSGPKSSPQPSSTDLLASTLTASSTATADSLATPSAADSLAAVGPDSIPALADSSATAASTTNDTISTAAASASVSTSTSVTSPMSESMDSVTEVTRDITAVRRPLSPSTSADSSSKKKTHDTASLFQKGH